MMWLKLGGLLALIAALWAGEQAIEQRGFDRAQAQYATQIERQKSDAATLLAQATARASSIEAALQQAKQKQEQQDAQHQATNADLQNRLRLAAGPAGRLRDPHAAGCGGGSSSPTGPNPPAAGDRAADGAPPGGLLSKQLTELLWSLALDADTINAAYASCRAYAGAVSSEP